MLGQAVIWRRDVWEARRLRDRPIPLSLMQSPAALEALLFIHSFVHSFIHSRKLLETELQRPICPPSGGEAKMQPRWPSDTGSRLYVSEFCRIRMFLLLLFI